ncbi:hypothetical protein [Halobellus sp. H-GB7]|uniref:hypothetical protein n=1 Tax=Halobellus sp. H-GB7 TaxID=3069756 RepID=UPI0027B49ECB|nr:hypothetical protein [Halobellus sp. H-GB7]MDQ2054717.1 hypothetical protein [Halobellus sp. H-GB7]
MSLGGDDRAVTVQIGAVLLLGFLVISLSLYQATVVPQENRQIEFQHNQRVQSDLQEVRNTILGTAATGSSGPVSVELGTRYPTRVVAVNPAPPSGTLSTSSLGTVQIRNATADDRATTEEDYPETADFWNGTTHNYTTKSLVYRPSYANYDGAPATVYENGIVYNRFRSGNLTLTDQPIVSGRRISLVTLSGDLSRGGASTLAVDPRAVSVSTRTISISNESTSENVSIFVPSELNRQSWLELLNQTGEYDPAADPNDGGYVYRVEERPDGIELFFERDVTYQLKLSKVGVGTNVDDTEPAYLTSVEDLTKSPFAGRTYPFVVESRDKYNNPVGTSVLGDSQSGTVPDGVVVESGRYRYQYTAGAAGPDWVNVTYRTAAGGVYDVSSPAFEGDRNENIQYTLDVQAASGGGPDDGGSDTSAITIEPFDIDDNSKSNRIKGKIQTVTAKDSDSDDDVQELTIELVDGNRNIILIQSDTSAGTGSLTITDKNFNEKRETDPYVVRVTAKDADGNVEVKEKAVG